ncbi:MAG TPA: hypothetical protein VIJ57_03030 [Hanamia sp.]
MKKLFFYLLFAAISFGAFAQKSDTLNVPLGKYKFIKVGDKVYKVVTTLEEVTSLPTISIDSSSIITTPYFFGRPYTLPSPNIQGANTNLIYYLNNANKSEQFTN